MPILLVAFGAVLLVGVVGAAVHAVPSRIQGWARTARTATQGAIEAVHDRIDRTGAAWTAWYTGLLLLLLAATTLAGVALLQLVTDDGATPLDRGVLDFFHLGRTPLLSSAWNVITVLGASSFLVPLALVGGLAWRWRRGDWFVLSVLGGAYLGAAVLFNTAKRIVARARPAAEVAFNEETGHAFPSGHTTDAAAVYTALGLLLVVLVAGWTLRVVLGSLTAALVILIAMSRLYLGAHWVTDVVAGGLLGTVWAGLLWLSLTARAGPYHHYVTSPDRGVGARDVGSVRAGRP